jgi:hypothetical protein
VNSYLRIRFPFHARILVLSAVLCLAGMGLPAQASQPSSSSADTDLDNLFNGGTAGTTPEGTGSPSTNPSVRPDDLTRDDKVHFFGSADVLGEIGAGWSAYPPLDSLGSYLGGEGGGSLSANLGFEVRPANELRLRAKLNYYFPGPGPLFSEMIIDYSLLNSVFFRAGIFDYTWGNSQFFLFGNLPSRALPGWSGTLNLPFWERNNLITSTVTSTVPASLKVSIPFGLNGLTLLARLDMANYGGTPGTTTTDPRDGGYGLEWDMVTGPVEWSIGGFYQRLLTPRSLLALKTHLLGFDLSAELTLASAFSDGQFQIVYPTVTAGISREWTDAHIKLIAEYGYNGERNPGISLLPDETGPGGHNSAMVLRFTDLGPDGLAFTFLWQHNWSDGSGLVAPFLEISPVALTTLQIGLPLLYGPDSGEVLGNRLVPGSKRFGLLVLVKVSASFRQ